MLLTHHLTAGQLKRTRLSPSSGPRLPRLPRLRCSLEEGIPGVGEGVRPLVQADGAARPPPDLIGFFYPPSFSQLVCLGCNDSAHVPVHNVHRPAVKSQWKLSRQVKRLCCIFYLSEQRNARVNLSTKTA